MERRIDLNDALHAYDQISTPNTTGMFRTKIIGGHDLYTDPRSGMLKLRETLFQTENKIVIGGTLFALEKMFNVRANLNIQYLNQIMNIANSGTDIENKYLSENFVNLFGVGISGSGDAINTVKDVKFVERELGNMVPFRHTSTALSAEDAGKYWFKKLETNSNTSYYLKTFDRTPVIKALWDDGVDGEDGSEVQDNVHQTSRTESIFTFVELILRISKKDIVEWFTEQGNIEQCRVNTVGLFTGVKGTLADSSQDYKLVKMFSKFNFNNEMLDRSKELVFIYRIYTA